MPPWSVLSLREQVVATGSDFFLKTVKIKGDKIYNYEVFLPNKSKQNEF